MKRFNVLGLCLVAVFALSAAVVSSASAAAPEYFTCIIASPPNTGHYKNHTCAYPGEYSVNATEKWERAAWNKGQKVTFKGKNVGTPHNNSVDPFTSTIAGTVECKKEKVAGQVTGPKTTEWQTEYTGCKEVASGFKCWTHALNAGHVKTQTLTSELVFLNAAKTHPGIVVRGTGPVGGPVSNDGRLAQYECGPTGSADVNVEVFGQILVPVTGNTEEARTSSTYTAAEGPKRLQAYTYVEEFPFGVSSEAYAKGWWEYEEEIKECEEGFLDPPGPNTRTQCEIFLGGPNPVPVKPVMLESYFTGAVVADAPDIQNGVTVEKGEWMGIEL